MVAVEQPISHANDKLLLIMNLVSESEDKKGLTVQNGAVVECPGY